MIDLVETVEHKKTVVLLRWAKRATSQCHQRTWDSLRENACQPRAQHDFDNIAVCGARLGYAHSTFPSNYIIERITKVVLYSCGNSGIIVCLENKQFDLEYTNDVFFRCEPS